MKGPKKTLLLFLALAVLVSGCSFSLPGLGREDAKIASNPCAKNACNPCSKKMMNACNPCGKKMKNACNPCAKNACNPCGKKMMNACNPCGGGFLEMANPCNPCGAVQINFLREDKFTNLDEAIALGEKLANDPHLGKSGKWCNKCHKGGRAFKKSFLLPYPHYVKMAKDVVTLDQMINFCMINPMKTDPLPYGSKEMTAIAAYVKHVYPKAYSAKLAANPCAANPCAKNPCAANPCASNPCAKNPCSKRK